MRGSAKNWKGLLADAASDRLSFIMAAAAIGLAFLFFLTTPEKVLPLWVGSTIIIFLLCALFIAIHALRTSVEMSPHLLPRLLAVVDGRFGVSLPILLLEPNELFGIESVVSLYHRNEENGFEILIGYGSVLTIQSDNKIQIQVDEWIPGNEDISEKVCQQNVAVLKGVVVRPNAPRSAGNFVTQDELINVLEALKGSARVQEAGRTDDKG